MTEQSCGGVVYTRIHGTLHYVIVTERDGHTSLPKGHMEMGETPAETALREIREETNLTVTLRPNVSFRERYPLPHGGQKQVTYFLAHFERQQPTPVCDDVREVALLPLEKALQALTFEGARNILREADALLTQEEPSTSRPEPSPSIPKAITP